MDTLTEQFDELSRLFGATKADDKAVDVDDVALEISRGSTRRKPLAVVARDIARQVAEPTDFHLAYLARPPVPLARVSEAKPPAPILDSRRRRCARELVSKRMIFASGMTPTLAATVLKRIRPVETYGAPRARRQTGGGVTMRLAIAARRSGDPSSRERPISRVSLARASILLRWRTPCFVHSRQTLIHSRQKLAWDFWFAYRLLARPARINS